MSSFRLVNYYTPFNNFASRHGHTVRELLTFDDPSLFASRILFGFFERP